MDMKNKTILNETLKDLEANLANKEKELVQLLYFKKRSYQLLKDFFKE